MSVHTTLAARRLLPVAGALVALLVAAPAASAGTMTSHSFTHDGITRTYLKYIPSDLPDTPKPLVIALHGGNGSASGVSASDHPLSEWQVLAENEKFIVVYPDGVDQGSGQQWHDCRSDSSEPGTADDVGFVSALIDHVDVAQDVDLNKVYASGVSNGGMMSLRLARQLSNRIAAVGAIIANDPVDPAGECGNPANPISVIMMNGDADPLMPWNGGCVKPGCNGTVDSTFTTRNYYIGQMGTSTSPTTLNYPNINTQDDGSTVRRYRYTGGSQGTEVALFRVFNGGHNVPSIAHQLTEFAQVFVGNQNWDIEGVHKVWELLKLHTLTS